VHLPLSFTTCFYLNFKFLILYWIYYFCVLIRRIDRPLVGRRILSETIFHWDGFKNRKCDNLTSKEHGGFSQFSIQAFLIFVAFFVKYVSQNKHILGLSNNCKIFRHLFWPIRKVTYGISNRSPEALRVKYWYIICILFSIRVEKKNRCQYIN
jgi:hypothetical protein